MKLSSVIIFVAGVGAGAAGMYFGLKENLKKKYVEDISRIRDEIKASYYGKDEDKVAVEEVKEEHIATPTKKFTQEKPPLTEYHKITSKYIENEKKDVVDAFNLIKFEDLSDDYLECVYYEDQYLVDENDVVLDVSVIGGFETLAHFGDEDLDDPDILYVRNETLGKDYEIVRDPRSYADLIDEKNFNYEDFEEDDD